MTYFEAQFEIDKHSDWTEEWGPVTRMNELAAKHPRYGYLDGLGVAAWRGLRDQPQAGRASLAARGVGFQYSDVALRLRFVRSGG